MITRKKFSERLVACVAAGSLANFTLVAAPAVDAEKGVMGCKVGKDACSAGGAKGDSCGNSGGKGQDGCHGAGARADSCRAPAPDAQPPVPACKTDTCAASDKPSGNE